MRESHAELQEIHDTLRLISQPAPSARTPQKTPQKRVLQKQPMPNQPPQKQPPQKQPTRTQLAPPLPVTPLGGDRPPKAPAKATSKVARLDAHPAWQPTGQPSPEPERSIDLPPLPPRSTGPSASPHSARFATEPAEPAWDGQWDGQADWQAYPSHRADPTADTMARLQEKSTQYLRQMAQSVWDSPAQQLDVALRQLEAQAQHINDLATTQEAALLELKAIAQQIEHDWKTLEMTNAAQHGYAATDLQIPTLCNYGQTAVPQIEKNDRGVLMVSARSIDWFKTERDAELMAQALRHRAKPDSHNAKSSWTTAFSRWLLGVATPTLAKSTLAKSTSAKSTAKPAAKARHRRKPQSFNLREGATLMVGAMLMRVLLNLLVAAHPVLQFPAILLMATPGAIALYRSTVTPQSMLLWGGRLVSIMLGFWLAGRLFF
jgi:hypothetical protein